MKYTYRDYCAECWLYGITPLSEIELSLRNGVDRALEEARQQQPNAPAPKAEGRPSTIMVSEYLSHQWRWLAHMALIPCHILHDGKPIVGVEDLTRNAAMIRYSFKPFDSCPTDYIGVLTIEWLTPAPAAPPAESVGVWQSEGFATEDEYLFAQSVANRDADVVRLEAELAASRVECERLRTAIEPFALFVSMFEDDEPDYVIAFSRRGFETLPDIEIKLSDFRNAAKASPAAGEEA